MIGEASALNSTIQTERVYRDNSGETAASPSEQQDVSQQNSSTDTVALSPEAVALARNVAPAGETSDILDTNESTITPTAQEELESGGRIDLTV